MFEQVAGRSNIMRRCLVEKGCIATRFDSVCNVCFIALPFSERLL
jgi:hypothetical protein